MGCSPVIMVVVDVQEGSCHVVGAMSVFARDNAARSAPDRRSLQPLNHAARYSICCFDTIARGACLVG